MSSGAIRGNKRPAIALALALFAMAAWFTPLVPEGRVLWVLSPEHGLTTTDLLGFAAFITASLVVRDR